MANISVGSVSVRVVPDAGDFAKELRAKLAPVGAQIGAQIGKSIGEGIRKGLGDPLSGPLRDLPTKNKPQTEKDGESLGGAFADGFSRRLRAAFQALPKAKIDAESSEADRKVEELRTELESLSKKTVGVDIDAGEALGRIAEIKAQLDELSKTANIQVSADTAAAAAKLAEIGAEAAKVAEDHPNIQVTADTARAIAELTAVDEEASRLDRIRARVSVDADTSGALAGIQAIGFALAGLGAIPVAAPLIAGIGGLVPALGAAGAGFGGLAAVALPALSQIKAATQAQQQAQQNAGQTAIQGQQRALALAGAQEQLAAAVRNEAFAHQQALQQVGAAEQQLAQAQVSAREAQISLTEARQAERQRLQDLKNSLADANLSIQQDQLNVDKARLALQQLNTAQADAVRIQQAQQALAQAQAGQQTVSADPGASQAQKTQASIAVQAAQAALKSAQNQQQANNIARQQAKLAYEQAIQQLKEEQLAYQRLQQEQTKADRQGVEGSDQVRRAREALAQANQRVQNSEQQLAQARQNVSRSDQQAAQQVTAAQRALQQAQLQSAQGNTALASAMGKLSPAARTLMGQWQGLTREFQAWSRSLQPAVLPLFGRGIQLVRDMLPTLTPVVRGAAGAVNGLITDVSKAARSPFWTQFRVQMTNLVPTAITGLGKAAGNVATGVAGVVKAFLPFAPIVLGFLDRITAGFARWGKGLGTSNGFAKFMDYARQNLPLVVRTVEQLVTSVGHVVSALAPLGPGVLGSFGLLLRIVGGLKPGEIQAIAIAIGVIVAAVKAWRIAQLLLDVALDANPIGLIVVAVGALIAAVVLAYNHVGWFRAAVQAAWHGIQVAALFVWNSVLKPVFNALKVAVQAVGSAAMWLWTNAIRPAFNFISIAGRLLAAIVIFAVVAPIVIAFKVLQAAALFLWRNVFVPAWHGIQAAAMFAWNNVIRPTLNALRTGIRAVGSVFTWLWHNIVAPVWHGIYAIIIADWRLIKTVFDTVVGFVRGVFAATWRWLWNNVIKPVWNDIWTGIKWVWENGIRPVFNAVKSAIGLVGDAFKAGANAIKWAWDKIRDYTKAPVHFVIETVYNGGIVGLWNKVMGWLHLPGNLQLKPYHAPGLAAGGELSAAQPIQPMKVNRPVAIVGEGNQCIALGTLIETEDGPCPIENVSPGSRVLTRNGYRLVKWSGCTRPNAEVLRVVTTSGDQVVCTPDHRIWTAKGTHGDRSGDCLGCGTFRGRGVVPCCDEQAREPHSLDAVGHDGPRHGSEVSGHRRFEQSAWTGTSWPWAQADVRGRSGGARGREASDYRIPSVAGCPSYRASAGNFGADRGTRRCCGAPEELLQAGTPVDGGEHLHQPARHSCVPYLQEGSRPRMDAPEACWREARELTVGDWVWTLTADGDLRGSRITAVEPTERIDTYDLTVEGEHEFVAGGILVHNSYPEYVIPTDPKFRGRASALWAAAGGDLQMLAGGGIIGGILKTVKGIAGKVVNLGKDALNLITNPKAVWDDLVKKMVPSAEGLATSPFGKAAAAVPPKMLGEVWNAAKQIIDAFSSAFGGAGGQAMASLALTQVGTRENPPGSNNQKYSAGLGRPAEAWCADFVDWLAKQTGQSAAIPQTASAPGMARGFGSRFQSGSSGVQTGDIVFFDEGQGSIVHTGIAVSPKVGGSWTSVEGNYGDRVAKNTRSSAVGFAHPAYTGGAGGSFPGGSLIHASPAAAQAWARQALVGHGWSGQAGDLISLWNRESGWRWNATNPSSGAYGIPQSLPASKMGSAGGDWRDNAATQIKWGLGYIAGRYGSPAAALAHENAYNWYDNGGMLPVGPSLVYNGTGESEFVFRRDQIDSLLSGASGGGTHYHAHTDGWTRASVQAELRTTFHAMEVSNANRERIGRRR